ncbi:hypothetical protein L249_2951 [Ophiocordyceps polyrhachis-furcata BCC 54312]|uniref:Malate synthase n=1 Tax=Ophiocordyceps polyrhachis-furcata BCC 54312 TaxID=1330021 RepID=A0A367LQU0_9HYPO|nr:hypothetical protein L249_2951 [Ophiocordyceps polyrhachis-furcata BCC 54312]
MSSTESILQGVSVQGKVDDIHRKILTPQALAFLALLHRSFDGTRRALLERRRLRQSELDRGVLPDFLPETRHIRENATWRGAVPAPGLVDRRGKVDDIHRKILTPQALAFLALLHRSFDGTRRALLERRRLRQSELDRGVLPDFLPETRHIRENATWRGAVPAPGLVDRREYRLRTDRTLPTLIVRPRGWHLDEKHVTVDGQPMSGGLFDFGLYFFHNAAETQRRGFGPYFYLPKMESHLEARLWNDVFNLAQDYVGIGRGTIRATVLIETILAAFEMDEIIYELRDHSSGLNCGRWDYIFSTIKKFRNNSSFVLPDRSCVTMTVPFMDAYVKLLIQTCHKRGVHAMGGMAAQIPIKDDPQANDKAMENVRADKLREVRAGHDGTWVAHPALAAIAVDIFNAYMPTPNQLFVRRDDVTVGRNDLLNMNVPGSVSEDGIKKNLNIGLGYMEAWTRGVGCVPINYLMEDAATAEVSRSQLWQWVKHGVSTSDGRKVDKAYALKLLDECADGLAAKAPKGNKYKLAAQYFAGQITGEDYADFLTTLLYDEITQLGSPRPASKL